MLLALVALFVVCNTNAFINNFVEIFFIIKEKRVSPQWFTVVVEVFFRFSNELTFPLHFAAQRRAKGWGRGRLPRKVVFEAWFYSNIYGVQDIATPGRTMPCWINLLGRSAEDCGRQIKCRFVEERCGDASWNTAGMPLSKDTKMSRIKTAPRNSATCGFTIIERRC